MVRISRKCEYALRAVFELATVNDARPVKTHRIAAAQNIPIRFLEVILNELRHAGIVESRRGNAGGYMLARPAGELTVGEIIDHVQGPMATSDENATGKKYFNGDNAFGELRDSVARAVGNICNNTSFAELVERERRIRGMGVADYVI